MKSMRQRELHFEGLMHFIYFSMRQRELLVEGLMIFFICQQEKQNFILGHDRDLLHTEHTPGKVIVYIVSC